MLDKDTVHALAPGPIGSGASVANQSGSLDKVEVDQYHLPR